jgi:hypothetical protein
MALMGHKTERTLCKDFFWDTVYKFGLTVMGLVVRTLFGKRDQTRFFHSGQVSSF